MKNRTSAFFSIICTLLFLLTSARFAAAQEVKHFLYQGTVDQKPVRFYLKQLPNQCGGSDLFEAIYQYGKGKNWIELLNQTNDKGNFCFTEVRFTGVLILKKIDNRMEGIWISPDTKEQLKVTLTLQNLTSVEIKELEEGLERTHYENFDC